MEDNITTTYGGIEIEYQENKDRWRFELNGREHFAESLAKAKERIDHTPKPKKPFKRIPAYYRKNWNDEIERVEITSVSESNYLEPNVWVVSASGKRQKLDSSCLYEISTDNDQVIKEVGAISDQIDALEKTKRRKLSQLKHVQLPNEKGE
jgi:hypothetical protein